MNKKISITEKNIFEGEKANPQNCAIARALKEQVRGKITAISVLPSHVTFSKKGISYFAEMPKQGASFIKRFDEGKSVNKLSLSLKFEESYSLV
jgi:hypothetical protein